MYTHTHTHARSVQGGGADEAVAAFGLRQMMDGRELMTVLAGCSLPFLFLPHPSPYSVSSALSLPVSLCVSLPPHTSMSKSPHPPTFLR